MMHFYYWIFFNLFILLMLGLDLGIFHRKAHKVSIKESMIWTLVWITLSLIFNLIVYFWRGPHVALEFFTGYLIEKALSVDNIFVMMLIFDYFKIPSAAQHRVLFWGIIGALVMRSVFIFAGVALLQKFSWTIYILGGLLVFTGIKMAFRGEEEFQLDTNSVIRFVKKIIPVSDNYEGNSFFTSIDGKRYVTPLFLCLIFIEVSDLIFAVDSIPAILAITKDQFIVYTSNAFAILGLRSLYFSLAGLVDLFRHLRYGLSVILVFVGIKMLLEKVYEIPTGVALGIVFTVLLISICTSILFKPKSK